MGMKKGKNTQLIVLFIIGIIFFNYPILALFNINKTTLLGIPLLYTFVYIFWALLIGLTIHCVNRRQNDTSTLSGEGPK